MNRSISPLPEAANKSISTENLNFMKSIFLPVLVFIHLFVSSSAVAQIVEFKDPKGDDKGPGTYIYPSDPVYKPGSFDLRELKVDAGGGKIYFDVGINSPVEDSWQTGTGFSVQMIFIFIDNAKGGFKDCPPGVNAAFADGHEWDKLVIISPQQPGRVRAEVAKKMPEAQRSAVVVPLRVKGLGQYIAAEVDLSRLGEGNPAQWGYQVLMLGQEGYPAGNDLLTRRVNEFEGQHKFGGGHDGDCDPHIIDLLAGKGAGDRSEIGLQNKMLAYACQNDGTSKKPSLLSMIRK
jgi:prepilin-type processing-associated H-X9-DG protein